MEKINREIQTQGELQTGCTKLYTAIDAGSNGTRSMLFNLDDITKTSEVLEIESQYAEVSGLPETTLSASKDIADNLYFIINDITEGKEIKLFQKTNILKGSLMRQVTRQSEQVSSSESKAETAVTYVNILTNLIVRTLLLSESPKGHYAHYKFDITAALRPNDATVEARCNQFISRLQGKYEVQMPRLNYSAIIEISPDDIYIESEPNAILRFWAVKNMKDLKTIRNVILFDGGGSSTDIGVFRDGVLFDAASVNKPYAGSNFENMVGMLLERQYGLSSLSKEDKLDAIKKGYALNFEDYSAVDAIKTGKKEYTKRLLGWLNEALNMAETQIKAIDYIICTGNLFRESGSGEFTVPSVVSVLGNQIAKLSPRTKVKHIKQDHAMVYGLAVYRVSRAK